MSSKELVFAWKQVRGKSAFGKISRPIALVQIKAKSGDWKIFYPEVDSGSPITVFTESDCDRLGFTLEEGKPVTLGGVLGGSRSAYVHELEMKIGDEVLKSRIAFTTGIAHKQLLGRIDVFDSFGIGLHGKHLQTIFVKE
jgi:hypothetical protein